MTPLEQLQENMKNELMAMYDKGMKDGFNLAIKVIDESAHEAEDYEYAIWHAKNMSKEKFGE
jgi:hypothetical protein